MVSISKMLILTMPKLNKTYEHQFDDGIRLRHPSNGMLIKNDTSAYQNDGKIMKDKE